MLDLQVIIEEDFIAVNLTDGTEVVCWSAIEWETDLTIVPAICNAIHLAHTNPEYLVKLNQQHIDSQKKFNSME